MDKRQKLESSKSFSTHRIARRSYGMLCMEPYNPRAHIGEDRIADSFDNDKEWAVDQIDWIIIKVLAIWTGTQIVAKTKFNRAISWILTFHGSERCREGSGQMIRLENGISSSLSPIMSGLICQ
jgi:hypothetical protein